MGDLVSYGKARIIMATVPVNDNIPLDQYVATASQTVFPYTFWADRAEDLDVYADGVLVVYPTAYSVSGLQNDNGGNVTFVTGLAAGVEVSIARSTQINRISGFSEGGGGSFRSEACLLYTSGRCRRLVECRSRWSPYH